MIQTDCCFCNKAEAKPPCPVRLQPDISLLIDGLEGSPVRSRPQRVQLGDSGDTVQGRLLRMLKGTGADKLPLPCFILHKTNHRNPLAEA